MIQNTLQEIHILKKSLKFKCLICQKLIKRKHFQFILCDVHTMHGLCDIVSKTSRKPLPNSDAQSNQKLFETSNAKGPHDVQKSSRLTVEICASRMNFIYTLRTQESI